MQVTLAFYRFGGTSVAGLSTSLVTTVLLKASLGSEKYPSDGVASGLSSDTRFSPDKRPSKTHLTMRFSRHGRDAHSSSFCLHLERGG